MRSNIVHSDTKTAGKIFFEKKGEEMCESQNESSPVWSSTGEAHRSKDCNGNVNDGPRTEWHNDIGKNILGL